jgi:Flp pilus assembly protein TadG
MHRRLYSRPGTRSGKRGFSLVWGIVVMTALLAFTSLAVDLGRAQTAKTELQVAADAAARYGATGLADGTYITKALDAADDNKADGSTITIASSDVVKGYYDSTTKTFTANGSPTNALQVTCARTGTNGVQLLFGQAIGKSRISVTAKAIASATPRLPGFTGLSYVSMKNNNYIGSYDSSLTKTPSSTSGDGKSAIGSNGSISVGVNNTLSGNVLLGPSGTTDASLTQTNGGTTSYSSTALTPPPDPAWNPGTNPGGIPQNYTVSSNTVLAGGTYWFTSLTINANLSFSGSATLYINGNVVINAALTAYQSVPGNLQIYQIGSGHTFGDTGTNNISITAVITAPNVDFAIKNNIDFYGAALFKSITVKNNANFYYDEQGGSGTGGTSVSLVR